MNVKELILDLTWMCIWYLFSSERRNGEHDLYILEANDVLLRGLLQK